LKGAPLRLFMTTDAVGGVWTYAIDLAGELAKAGVRTTLAVMGPSPGRDQMRSARAVSSLELIDTGLPLDWTAQTPGELEIAAREIAALAHQRRAHVVHLNSPALAAYAEFEAPVIGVCHSCVGTWWEAAKGGDLPEDLAWRAEALGKGYAACDALVAPSQAFADATGRRYGVAAPTVIHNGRRWPTEEQPKSDRVIFTSGRLWDPGKNLAVLDAAAAQLDVPVFAAGPLESPVGERVELSHLRLLGRLPQAEVGRWVSHAQVFASTALYEPFGLSVLEAAQAGCALVLSDIATFRELWDGAAVFVPPSDEEAIARALQALIDDPGRAHELGDAAKARAANYTVEAMAAGVLSLYRALAKTQAIQEAAA